GVDGNILRIHDDPHPPTDPLESSNFGFRVATLGDVDGDAVAEYAVAEPGSSSSPGSLVNVYDGASGDRLASLPSPLHERGSALLSLVSTGDYNTDGVPDLWVGGFEANAAALMTATGATLTTLTGPEPASGFGSILTAVAPLAPGAPDLVVS